MKNIKGLRVDVDAGEAEVVLPETFYQESYLWQADVLGDWKHDITKLYNDAVENMYAEFAKMSVAAYRKKNAKETKANIESWTEAAASGVGGTITGITRGKEGEFFIKMTKDGNEHTLVMFHGGSINGEPQVACDIIEEMAPQKTER